MFDQDESLKVLTRLRARGSAVAGTAECEITIVDAGGRDVFMDSSAYPIDDLTQPQGLTHVVEVPLAGLSPGEYSLTVRLRADGVVEPAEAATVRFSVRAGGG